MDKWWTTTPAHCPCAAPGVRQPRFQRRRRRPAPLRVARVARARRHPQREARPSLGAVQITGAEFLQQHVRRRLRVTLADSAADPADSADSAPTASEE